MRKYLFVFFFVAINLFAQDFFAPMLWKLSGNNLIPTNATAKVPYTYIDGIYTGYDPTTTLEIMEEFVSSNASSYSIGTHGWKTTGTGSVGGKAADNTSVGDLVINSSATIAGFVVSLSNPSYTEHITGTYPNMTVIFRSKISSPQAIGDIRRMGLGQVAATANPQEGIFFRLQGNGQNWYAVTRRTNIETATNTGVTGTSSGANFHTFKIVTNSTGTSVNFYIDNVLVATHTTNLPTLAITPILQIEETTSPIGIYTVVDYFYLKITNLTR